MRKFILFILLLPFSSFAQTSISGIVNSYAHVRNKGTNYIISDSASLFSAGDVAILIQMNGALMDTTNTSAYGNVISYRYAGNYEFLNVASVAGNTVNFMTAIINPYDTNYAVQLVKVPKYNSAIVSDTLKARNWQGQTGGVLAIYVLNKLTLNSFINTSGAGFRGGAIDYNPDGSCGTGYTDYYYPYLPGTGGEKGEGITNKSTGKETGRGAQSTGGGGGNKHNSGGGGGGNYTSGGVGGDQANFCPTTTVGGIGGKPILYADLGNRIFMGGGGGCSDYNDGVGTYGTNGGGIVIVIADTLEGNGDSILANGPDQTYIYNSIGDGAGGGGAGGTVFLKVKNYGTTPVHISANGGHGGDEYTTYPACFGPGGGGGAGVFMLDTLYIPSNVSYSTAAGAAGEDINPSSSCYLTSYGASGGDTGRGLIINNLVMPTLGVQALNKQPGLTVFNNHNQLSINCDQLYTDGGYTVTDMVGRILISNKPLLENNTNDISGFAAGVYNVVLNIEGQRYYKRFVKY